MESSRGAEGPSSRHPNKLFGTSATSEEFTQTLPFSNVPEVIIAVEAVRKAAKITEKLQKTIDAKGTLTKDDESPVTVGDFACQAIVLQHLRENLPNGVTQTFLAEEKSSNLTPALTEQILKALSDTTSINDEDTLRSCIDLGQNFFDSHEIPSHFFCLDPIDGTKGFFRKEQYCIALGLLENGMPTIAVLACPNLPFVDEEDGPDAKIGCIFVACKGQGCYQLDMEGKVEPKRIGEGYNAEPPLSHKARFCVGVEQGFGDPTGKAKVMAQELHGSLDETTDDIKYATRIDSQAKYGLVARGGGELYVRLPRLDYEEWMWDVAPGVLVLEESGGIITDANGNDLDFTSGSKLSNNYGVLGARSKPLYDDLLASCRSASQ
ncbi:unnamed protein product [Cylindrotheca closterium]|uniref:3'(2'),5'-bisphosphate nucleotidase n=1 Tax=Cylindrotheca closterium TaxID=2856 RepID=A0AAD2JN41_9STRA|nr:unnamed protein product [Cylindrotheca closterium]